MNFDITEETEETSVSKKKKIPSIVIIVICALIVGLIVFLICNSIFNPKDKNKPKEKEVETSEKLSLNENNVKILYQYVTYGTTGIRNDKFVKESKVDIKSFTNEEKYYYALMFAEVDDFSFTGRLDSDKNKIYSISSRKIKKYMERFFGKNVSYSTDIALNYPFTFSINGQNIGIMKYNEEESGYDTILKGISQEKEYIVEPYYGKLTDAYKEKDGSYRLVEKVLYIDLVKNDNNKYDVTIYKDYEHTDVIDTLKDQEETDLLNIKLSDYVKKGATVTYIFKVNGNVLYFDSSSIQSK